MTFLKIFDFHLHPGYDPSPFIDSVINSGLTDDEQEFIFYKNAERLPDIKIV